MSEADLEACFGRISITSETTQTTDPRQLKAIFDAVALLQQDDAQSRLYGMKKLRVVTTETPPPIDAIIDSGITPVVIHFLQTNATSNSNSWEIVWEASWVMLNLLSGNENQVIKLLDRENTVVHLLQLLSDADVPVTVKDHACWAIGNIAGTGTKYRDKLLEDGAVSCIFAMWDQLHKPENSVEFQRFAPTVSWTLANLTRQRFGPVIVTSFAPYVRAICLAIADTALSAVADEFCAVCSDLIESCGDFADLMQRHNGAAYLDQRCQYLIKSSSAIMSSKGTLILIGSLAGTTDFVTRAFCAPSVVNFLLAVASSSTDPKHRSSALWCLSNFAATPNCRGDLVESGVLDVSLAALQQLSSADVICAREAVVVAMHITSASASVNEFINVFPPFIAEIYAFFKALTADEQKTIVLATFDHQEFGKFCTVCDQFVSNVANMTQYLLRRFEISADDLTNVILPFLFSQDALAFCEQVALFLNSEPESKPVLDGLWEDIMQARATTSSN